MRLRRANLKQQPTRASLSTALLLALLIAGCSTGSDFGSQHPAAGAEAAGGTLHHVGVVMANLAFAPAAIHATVGERVAWTNDDSAPHNVTYVSGPRFTSSRPSLGRGATFSLVLTHAGTIHYFCTIHPWMKGTITVAQ